MIQDDPLLRPKKAADYTQVTTALLAQLRYRGSGPRYLAPTPRTILYRRSALDQWLEASERTSTHGAA